MILKNRVLGVIVVFNSDTNMYTINTNQRVSLELASIMCMATVNMPIHTKKSGWLTAWYINIKLKSTTSDGVMNQLANIRHKIKTNNVNIKLNKLTVVQTDRIKIIGTLVDLGSTYKRYRLELKDRFNINM